MAILVTFRVNVYHFHDDYGIRNQSVAIIADLFSNKNPLKHNIFFKQIYNKFFDKTF